MRDAGWVALVLAIALFLNFPGYDMDLYDALMRFLGAHYTP